MSARLYVLWIQLQEKVANFGLFLLASLVAGGLTGCAALTPPAPVAKIPVAVSCVAERPVSPLFRSDSEVLAMDDYRAVLALRAERLKARSYIGDLEDVVTACAQAPKTVTVKPGAANQGETK